MIDIKRLLYAHKKNEVRFQNIQTSLNKVAKEYPAMTQRYNDDIQGKGGYVYSQTERFALHNVLEVEEKQTKLREQLQQSEDALNLVRNAFNTLNQQQRDLIDIRYFQDRKTDEVARMIHVTEDYYWKLHKIAFGGIEDSLNKGELSYEDNPFVPKKKEKARNVQKIAINISNNRIEFHV